MRRQKLLIPAGVVGKVDVRPLATQAAAADHECEDWYDTKNDV